VFRWFKKAGVTAGVAGALAVATVAGSPPAPAQAVAPLILIPIAGAAAAGGTTVSLGGMLAGIGAIAGTVGLGLAISQPGSSPIKDWLNEEVSNPWEFFFGKTDEPAPTTDTVKTVPDVIDPFGNTTPSQSGYVHISTHIKLINLRRDATSKGIARYDIQHQNTTASDIYLSETRELECWHTTDKVMRTVISTNSSNYVGYNPYGTKNTTARSVGCSAGEELMAITVRPPTTAEKAVGNPKPPTGSEANYKGAPGSHVWRSASHPGYANKQILAEATCVTPEGVRTKISLGTDLNPDGSMPSNINIPSCKAAGLGDVAESLNVGWADGDKIKQPIFTARPTEPLLDCDPAFGQVCKVEIYVDGVPCVIGSPACESWAGLARVNPSRVQCMYGGKVVDMSACGIMEGAYVKGGTPAVKENTDGNPDTWKIPATVPGWQPHINPDGDPVPDPNYTPDPNRDPELDPRPNPNPDPDVTKDPAPEPSPEPSPPVTEIPGGAGSPNPSDTASAKCWPNGWAMLNPAEWVLKPLGCAFIPSKDVLARGNSVVTTVVATPPVSWLNPSLVGPGGGSCPDWRISIPGSVDKNVVCDSSFTGAILGARAPLFGLVATAMVWPLIRSLWYAAIPFLRVAPSK
jgi:hypothetical protein